MTSSLRRKLRITARGRNMSLRTAVSVCGAKNSNNQEPNSKNQEPNSKNQVRSWNLVLGSWSLGFALWLAAGVSAQESPPKADADGWAPPPAIPKASLRSTRLQTGLSNKEADDRSESETAKSSSKLYVNPTTGSTAPLPPPPPAVPADEWKPAPAVPRVKMTFQPPPKPAEQPSVKASSSTSYVNPGTGTSNPMPAAPPVIPPDRGTPRAVAPEVKQTSLQEPLKPAEQSGVTAPSSNLYVNPSTGSPVPLPPVPPSVSADEWSPATGFQPTSLQQQPPKPGEPSPVKAPKEEEEVQIQLEPPGADRIFGRRDSESSLKIRMQQEVRQQKRQPIPFPDEPILSTERYAARMFPPMTEIVEPNYVCYHRLYFEDKNSERYGWDLGFIQPFVSGGIFFWDVATLPYHLGTDPCRKYECNAGYCLPGDPVPYLLYPPTYSVTGAAAEIGTIVALAWIFPG